MALTLAQYKAWTTTGYAQGVINDLRRKSLLLDRLPFTDNGAAMGNKWVYSYSRQEAQRAATTRLVNTEYTPAEIVAPVPYTTELSIMGGSYTIDRVMANVGSNNGTIIEEQTAALVEATVAKFNDLFINGDASTPGEFDGLDQVLAGTTTEFNTGAVINLSSLANINTNWQSLRYNLNLFLALLGRKPDMFLVDDTFAAIFNEVAQTAGVNSQTPDNFGRMVDNFNGVPIVPMGTKSGSSTPVIGVETRTVATVSTTGLTDIYAVNFGPKEVHGVSPNDKAKLINAYEPDFERPGAVHLGEVELLATIAVESTKAAGVFRNIKII